MKLISLNTWCGRVYEPLKTFIERESTDTDIFCFQEIRNGKYTGEIEGEVEDLFDKLKAVLPNFEGYYTEMIPGIGITIFIRKNIKVKDFKSHVILSSEENQNVQTSNGYMPHPRVLQVLTLQNNLFVLNFHGIPGNFKKDTKERALQLERLQKVLDGINGPMILVGDFNLNPDTTTILELEKQFRNLVKEGNFKTTRSSLYERKSIMPFADYAFVSKDLEVKSFDVLPDEVSDHLALSVEFNMN